MGPESLIRRPIAPNYPAGHRGADTRSIFYDEGGSFGQSGLPKAEFPRGLPSPPCDENRAVAGHQETSIRSVAYGQKWTDFRGIWF